MGFENDTADHERKIREAAKESGLEYLSNSSKVKIDIKLRGSFKNGITDKKRHPRVIVSLTSFPERMNDIHYCLYSLLQQRFKPDLLVLWLASEQFPNKEKDLPASVLSLKKHGLTINWCSDLKSYKKLVPSLNEYPNDILVTADDDIYYPENWLKLLYDSYRKELNCIHAHRAHRIKFELDGSLAKYRQWPKMIPAGEPSFLNFMTSGGGALFPPNSLYKDSCDKKIFTQLCPTGDDIWFWAMAVLQGTKIKVIKNNIDEIMIVNPGRALRLNNEFTLWKINELENDKQINNILNYYKEIKEIIRFNPAEYQGRRSFVKGNEVVDRGNILTRLRKIFQFSNFFR
jgi:hypothetical protein